MKSTLLDPLGVESRLPENEQEWADIPQQMAASRGVLVVNDLDVDGPQLEQVLEKFASVLGHKLLPYDRWPGQSPGVAHCSHLALLGNYKARKENDIVSATTEKGVVQKGDAIAEYKPATLDISEWHTDGSFLERPKTYIALYAPMNVSDALPPEGGETRFCSTLLTRAEQEELAGWTSVHSWETFMRFLAHRDPKRPKVTQEDCDKKPDQTWPLVTSRGHLYINPKNTKAVYDGDGKAVENPTKFVYELAQRILERNRVYWHKWRPGQLVLWDNQATLHAATPFDATKYERLLYRAEFGPWHVPSRVDTVKWGYLEPTTPIATVPSGSVVVVDTVSGSVPPPPSFTKIPPELAEIKASVKERVGPHILTGPIAIDGAEPGDVLQIDILNVRMRSDWAYTIHKKSGEVRHTKLTENGMAITPWGSQLDCRPFFGILGVAKAERVSSIPPSASYGGNLDLRRLVAGSTLYIPIHEKSALLYVGDGHARQGDGECCGTALETSLTGTFRLTIRKNMPLVGVRAETATDLIGIGVEDTVDAAVESALGDLVRWIQEERPAISTVDAECLCSVAADIGVTQVVNGATRGAHVVIQKAHLPPAGNTA